MNSPLRKCRMCGKEANTIDELELFMKDKTHKHGRQNICKECLSKKRKEHYWKNHERIRKFQNAYSKKYREQNREKVREQVRKWGRKKYWERKVKIFQLLGDKCVKCGFSNKKALHIDHINGGGQQQKKSYGGARYLQYVLDHPDEFQILCANCNQIKKYDNREAPYRYEKHKGYD